MKVIDVFPFFNEFEILSIRLEELWDIVDQFIIVEAPYTFMMNEKPYYFSDVAKDLPWCSYEDKIMVMKIQKEHYSNVDVKNPWNVEKFQRNYPSKYLESNCEPEDVIIFSDVDEIPMAKAVKEFIMSQQGVVNFETYLCRYRLDLFFQYWQVCQMFRWNTMVDYINDLHSVRKVHCKGFPVMRKAGWHFSSIGDIEAVWEKVTNFSHAPEHKRSKRLNKERIEARMKQGIHPFKDGKRPGRNLDTDLLPDFVVENYEHFLKKGLVR